ncbi:DUF3679 domain-containing protein [Rossellomorea vietnamensis]|uniref:DUF3679 domain-containing protein n=1 Tax=Rossellomorea vietnamensis TaxID=218284 RepID=A0A0P6WQI6_9BACI|nr:DUF3679 domain-containing protein [Rossellomorea vietnamensis]KPL58627.1 hypothetical protein AM506_16050 [Rossellomorea vietnamensis]
MTKFFFKCAFLITALFIGVLIGMQYANQGIVDMKGHEQQNFTSPVGVNQKGDGDVEASFLGNEIDSKTLTEKKEKLEEMKAFNVFSSIGKVLASTIESITNTIVDVISSLI